MFRDTARQTRDSASCCVVRGGSVADSASHTSATAHELVKPVFQPRQSQGVDERDEEFEEEESKGSHKRWCWLSPSLYL